MPILKNAKTVWVDDNPWQSPDGKVTIWKVKLEVDGERELHSTMSKVLATEGWQGDVEVYTNQKGKDYVRQAPKEEHGGSASAGQVAQGRVPFRADPEKQAEIKAEWAIGQALSKVDLPSAIPNQELTQELTIQLRYVEQLAARLFKMVDNVKRSGSPSGATPALPATTPTNEPEEPQASAPARPWDKLGRQGDQETYNAIAGQEDLPPGWWND